MQVEDPAGRTTQANTDQVHHYACHLSKQENLTRINIQGPAQTEAGAHRSVADGSEDIQTSQSSQGVDGLQSAAKRLMEYVTDSSSSTTAGERGSAVTPMLCVSVMLMEPKLNAVNQKGSIFALDIVK